MIREYRESDRNNLCNFFCSIIEEHKEYISHGEIQMGLAIDEHTLSPDYKQVWLCYLDRQVEDSAVEILVYELSDKIEGFIIFGTENDSAAPYGVVFDMGVNKRLRGEHIGSTLIHEALFSLKRQGVKSVYLESGVKNHSAHGFFESFDFKHISNIFKVDI